MGGDLQFFVCGIVVIGIVILINIGKAVGPKVDGVGASGKTTVVFLRIFYLNG